MDFLYLWSTLDLNFKFNLNLCLDLKNMKMINDRFIVELDQFRLKEDNDESVN